MPGIIAHVGRKSQTSQAEFEKAKLRLSYNGDSIQERTFKQNEILVSRVHLGIGDLREEAITLGDLKIWFNGEQYSFEDNFFTRLLDAYNNETLPDFFSKIDGYFSLLMFDNIKKKVIAVSDRFGLKPLYLWHHKRRLIISSELKCFQCFSEFEIRIDPMALDCFLSIGQLIGNNTWFKAVSLMTPATILEYNVNIDELTTNRYWNWSEIDPSNDSFDKAVSEVDQRLKRAVEKRLSGSPILALSGGLDSRIILALGHNNISKTYTFGKKNSLDAKIAEKLSEKAQVTHVSYLLNRKNWIIGRLQGIWKTDGGISMLHMHGSPFHKSLHSEMKTHLNGFAGDLILGGTWISEEDQRINEATVRRKMGNFPNSDKIDFEFLDINKQDPYFINNRVRRLSHMGIHEATRTLDHRLPFFDWDLISYIYSLPDAYRKDYKLYHALYKKLPPIYFRTKNANTNAPLFPKYPLFHKLNNILGFQLEQAGLKEKKGFAEYPVWAKELKPKFEEILTTKEAILPDLLKEKIVLDEISIVDLLCFATAEIWLQQLFNQRFFTWTELQE